MPGQSLNYRVLQLLNDHEYNTIRYVRSLIFRYDLPVRGDCAIFMQSKALDFTVVKVMSGELSDQPPVSHHCHACLWPGQQVLLEFPHTLLEGICRKESHQSAV